MQRMTSFARATAKLPSAEQGALESVIARLTGLKGKWLFIASNLRQEHFLSGPSMRHLLRFFLGHLKTSPTSDELKAAYKKYCDNRKFRGREVAKAKLKNVTDLGNAKEYDTLVGQIFSANPVLFRDRCAARSFLKKVQDGRALSTSEKNVLLHQHMIWCTWSEDGTDPFQFATTSEADEVRAFLGLPAKLRGRLVIMRYPRSKVSTLFRPTIIDAGDHEYFEPPPLTFGFGLTKPWKPGDLPPTLKDLMIEPDRRPEALHKPVTFENVRAEVFF
ncbi:MAG: hypothetical protein JWM95_5527 [Gemmatimonadetes bacterium]|nr:hypothetical protein [Gemmatimonadota bacterium]